MNLLWRIVMLNASLSYFSTIHARADNNVSRCNTGKCHPTSDIKGYVLVLSNDRSLLERMTGIVLSIPDVIICDKPQNISLLCTKARRHKDITEKEQHDHFERPNKITEKSLLPTDTHLFICTRGAICCGRFANFSLLCSIAWRHKVRYNTEHHDHFKRSKQRAGHMLLPTNTHLYLCTRRAICCSRFANSSLLFTSAWVHKVRSNTEQLDHSQRPQQITENRLLPTDARLNTVYWSNKNHMQSTLSRSILISQNGTFDKWANNNYLKNISVKLFSIFKNGSLDKWLTIIDHMETISDGLFLMQCVSVLLFSFRKNDCFDKRLTADRMDSHNGSFEISDKHNSMEDISDKRYSMAAFRVKKLFCCKRTLDRITNQSIASLEHNWKMKNSNVLKTVSELEEEMQRKTNLLHYTRPTYLYLVLIMNKCQRNSHLLSHKPAITTNGIVSPISRTDCILICFMCICFFKSVSSQKFYFMLTSNKTLYWFLFQVSNSMLNKCFYISVYFPNVLHHVHKLRNAILQKLYPIVSPSFRIMIIRRYKRYQRDIIRTKVKEFFESYVKWLKAFNLKQKYIRSANIGNTCLKNRQRKNQLRGGRKRKCSFRKTGPFMYGKPLYKRNSLQRTSHLRRSFNIFTSSSQNSLNKAITSSQQTVTKTGKIARDAANNIWDLLRLRRFPRQTLIAVFPFLGSSVENEFSRVATYANFPTRTPVSTLRLARAGFFYTGSSDLVECFHCHVQHGNWETNDIPFEIHERISPSCDFILGNDTANTAIDRSSIQSGPHTSLLSTTSLAQSRNCETNIYGTLTSGELQTNSSAYASIGSERSSALLSTGSERSSALLSTGSECYEELHSDSIGFSNQCTENSLSTIDQEESGGFHQISTTASQTCSFENREHSMNRNANGLSSVVDKSKIHNKPTHSDCTRMGKMTNTQPRHHAATVQLKPLNQCHDRPKYIAYAVITVRMSTFKGWSSHTSQTPRELAAAGLFYTGCGDLVRCWFCGISLQSWETNDDPWIEHAKWAPTCLFLRRSKGDEFIQLVHERNNFCSHSNSTRNVEEPSMSPIQNAPEEIQTPLHLAATVERVKAMGYSTGLIQKAIETLQRDNTPIDTNSIVNELIENERSYFSNKPDRVKVSELAWNTAARTSEVASCSNGLTEGMRNLDIQESNRLMEENRRLRQELKCKICMDVDAVITFVPCGHMICCEDCGYAVSKCPVCRRAIETRVKTWMS